MYKFKVAIIENDICDRQKLQNELAVILKNIVPDCYENGEDFIAQNKYYDIIFLGYELPGMNGIETVENYRKKWPKTAIIFVSRHKEIIPLGYKVRAYRFLLKPIQREELAEAITCISQEREYQALWLEYEGKKYSVPVKNIVYIEAGKHGNGVVIRTGQHAYLDNRQLADYEDTLNAECFVRTHRSYIVNLFHVTEYGNGRILLRNGEKALLSTRSVKRFEEKMNEFEWKKASM